jgi:hypothetical protein
VRDDDYDHDVDHDDDGRLMGRSGVQPAISSSHTR